jgi:hypothetical protein
MKTLGLILTLALTSTFGLSACSGAAPPENECEADGDCPRGEVCEANECVPAPPECVSDADCAALEICTDDVCVAVECKVDADCELGLCAGFVCVDSCIGNHDLTVQCDNDMWLNTQNCLSCVLFGSRCPEGASGPRKTPIEECLNIALTLSFECGGCYKEFADCSTGCSCSMSSVGGGDPNSCKCWDCLKKERMGDDTRSCVEIFDECAHFNMMDGVPDCAAAPRECEP